MTIINCVDTKIEELKRQLPNNQILRLLEEYKVNRNYKNYHDALESFSFKFGVGFGCSTFQDSKGGYNYIPFIKYYSHNVFNSLKDIEYLVDKDKGFSDFETCCQFLVKELVYKLGEAKEPTKLIN